MNLEWKPLQIFDLKYLQEIIIEFILKWKIKTGADHPYYSGGVALNIVTILSVYFRINEF
ncbi:MAG: hypothetical protein K8R11_02385 [Methanococcoides sp.]|nr:hypothetical protein [Methanococcoides sp.]